jgi:hypothetical protein
VQPIRLRRQDPYSCQNADTLIATQRHEVQISRGSSIA